MSEFRKFSIGVCLVLAILLLLRRLSGDGHTASLDEVARLGFLAIVGGFAAVAFRGNRT